MFFHLGGYPRVGRYPAPTPSTLHRGVSGYFCGWDRGDTLVPNLLGGHIALSSSRLTATGTSPLMVWMVSVRSGLTTIFTRRVSAYSSSQSSRPSTRVQIWVRWVSRICGAWQGLPLPLVAVSHHQNL